MGLGKTVQALDIIESIAPDEMMLARDDHKGLDDSRPIECSEQLGGYREKLAGQHLLTHPCHVAVVVVVSRPRSRSRGLESVMVDNCTIFHALSSVHSKRYSMPQLL